jgi:cyclophilin family peptidyl-prolyl cis-trans isomerase
MLRWLILVCCTAPPLLAQGGPVIVLETSKGVVKIELLPEEAPKTVENFLRYVDAGFYADTVFHRVIPKFVVQGGGFTPELDLKPTFEPTAIETKNGLANDRGTVAMARMDDKDSATSQFFINLANNDTLNRSGFSFGYTVFGRVVEGMEVVDAIAGVQTSKRGMMDDVPILPVFLDRAYRAP